MNAPDGTSWWWVYHRGEVSRIGNLEEGEALRGLGEAGNFTLDCPVAEGCLVESILARPVQIAGPHVSADIVANEV